MPPPPTTPLKERLFRPVDGASLAVFRVLFGGIMFWEVIRYFRYDWINRYYVEPEFNFKYWGFAWVEPLPAGGMHAFFYGMGALALLILLGLFYRVAIVLFCLGFWYWFLLEQARYLNHFYLICLISFLMIWIPAHRAFSLDAERGGARRSSWVPQWSVWLLQAQLGVVYFFGGVAKLTHDWLRGEPIRHWLSTRPDFPVIGQWFGEEWMVAVFAYGGLLLDLLITPFLLWPRTRIWAFLAGAAFHLVNARLFTIGIFPWFMLGATLIFFPPDWPRRLLAKLEVRTSPAGKANGFPVRRSVTMALAAYLFLQVVVPLRHFLYPGVVHWTEEGHLYAWHMKLRSKLGETRFFVRPAADPSARFQEAPLHPHLADWQARKMSTRPDMILQFARHLEDHHRRSGGGDLEVRVLAWVSLNWRDPQLLIDPNVDLTTQAWDLAPAGWIVPLGGPWPEVPPLDARPHRPALRSPTPPAREDREA